METLPIWFTLPSYLPFDGQICWVRIKYYYSNPFLAVWDNTLNQFTSVENSIVYPAWTIARWREYSNAGDLSFTIVSDQTPLNTFTLVLAGFKYFAYSINWGDGSSVSGYWTGENETFVHNFGSTGNKNIEISMPSASLTYFDIANEPLEAPIPDLTPFFNLTYIRFKTYSAPSAFWASFYFPKLETIIIAANQLTGNFPSIADCASLVILSAITNSFSGSLPDPSGCPLLERYRFDSNSFTGDCPAFTNNQYLRVIRLANNALSNAFPAISHLFQLDEIFISSCGFTGAFPVPHASAPLTSIKIDNNNFDSWNSWVPPLACVEFWANVNAFPVASVNQILADFVVNLAARPAAGVIKLQGGTNAAPAGQGLLDKASIIAHGWTVTTN